MYHFFTDPGQISENEILITGSDFNHIKNVLRMHIGEQITVSSGGDGREYRCEIAGYDEHQVHARILWVSDWNAELPSKITLFQGLPKADKMELIIQKAVELGAFSIVPFTCSRCVVKLDRKKEEARLKRWTAISESAAKQAKRTLIPKIGPLCSFEQAVQAASAMDVFLIPYERSEDMDKTRSILSRIEPGMSAGIMIGPEGGFELSEVERAEAAGAKSITLGRRILRTETAGLAVLSALMFHLEGR